MVIREEDEEEGDRRNREREELQERMDGVQTVWPCLQKSARGQNMTVAYVSPPNSYGKAPAPPTFSLQQPQSLDHNVAEKHFQRTFCRFPEKHRERRTLSINEFGPRYTFYPCSCRFSRRIHTFTVSGVSCGRTLFKIMHGWNTFWP